MSQLWTLPGRINEKNTSILQYSNTSMKKTFRAKVDIVERCLDFGVLVIKVANKLSKTPAGYEIARQLVRAGTSVGANMEEAQEAVSKNDFIHKVNISLKETRESIFWLQIILKAKILPKKGVNPAINEAQEIRKILASIIWKTKKSVKTKTKF